MSIKFEKIEAGMKLFDVRKNTRPGISCNTNKWNTWPVRIVEVDAEKRKVLASWNGNKPEWMSERRVTKYRKNLPKER